MPAFNRERLIGEAIASLLGQTFSDWECIVVDDGSTDFTRSVIKDFASKDSRITLIEQANSGPGAARNTGAASATGKYLAFLDSDDLWMPWTLETYRSALDQAGWPEYLSGHQTSFRYRCELMQAPRPVEFAVFDDAISAYHSGAPESGAGLTVVMTDAFRRVGGFWEDRINAEDNDFTLRLGDCRGYVAMRNPVTIAYRRHGEQQSESQANNVAGILQLADRERAGIYPGGNERAHQRRSIIATHARPVCLAALRSGEQKLAWRLYRETFGWQLQSKRWRFLVAFPLLSLKARATAD